MDTEDLAEEMILVKWNINDTQEGATQRCYYSRQKEQQVQRPEEKNESAV